MDEVSAFSEAGSLEELAGTALDFVKGLGACEVGIATLETLAGGPPTTDLTGVLPQAKAAICFALPFDQSLIPPYLSKRDRFAHARDNIHASTVATGIAHKLGDFLRMKGHPSVGVSANDEYRSDQPLGIYSMIPPIAHRYLAVRSGVGWFGLSGNVITKSAGSAVCLATVVTAAELAPTDPLPADDNYCDRCGTCVASCVSGFIDMKEETSVTLGGVEFTYSKRGDYNRCGLVCGGFTGLHPSGKWSTWSPGRFAVPKDDAEIGDATRSAFAAHAQWPRVDWGAHNGLAPKKVWQTCGNCQLVCVPDKEERKRRLQLLKKSGVVVQNHDGALEAVSPEKARERLASMSPERRALYGGEP